MGGGSSTCRAGARSDSASKVHSLGNLGGDGEILRGLIDGSHSEAALLGCIDESVGPWPRGADPSIRWPRARRRRDLRAGHRWLCARDLSDRGPRRPVQGLRPHHQWIGQPRCIQRHPDRRTSGGCHGAPRRSRPSSRRAATWCRTRSRPRRSAWPTRSGCRSSPCPGHRRPAQHSRNRSRERPRGSLRSWPRPGRRSSFRSWRRPARIRAWLLLCFCNGVGGWSTRLVPQHAANRA